MNVRNWVAILGCVGLGVGGALTAQGCTATATIGPCTGDNCDDCTGSDCLDDFDSGTLPSEDSSTPASDTGTPNQDSSTPANPCNDCLYGACESQTTTCLDDQSVNGCTTIFQCELGCATNANVGACEDACLAAGTDNGQATYLALADCDLNAQCSNGVPGSTCGTSCSTSAATCAEQTATVDAGEDAAPGIDAGACANCQQTSCGTDLTACAAGSTCAAYNECLLGCMDQTCADGCGTSNSAGQMAATALGSCTSSNCAAACQ